VTNPQEWWSPSVPPGSAISGYSASTAGGCVVPFGQTLCEPSGLAATCGSLSYCDYPLFYWVDTGGSGTRFTFNYIYTQGGVTYTASAWVQVNVTAPSGISASAQTASVFIWAQTPPPPIMELGSTLLTPPGPGIQFTASPGTAPGNGQYWWTQLIGTEAFPIIFAGGRQLCLVASLAADPTPELDNTYPYGSPGNQASDSPLVYLSAEDGELSENFSAVMYLIWWPPADSRCPVGPGLPACAVPVPESYLGWSFCGDSINTLYLQPPPPNGNGTTWTLNGQSANPNGTAPFVPIMPSGSKTYGYPTWKNTIYKGSKTLTCTPYP